MEAALQGRANRSALTRRGVTFRRRLLLLHLLLLLPLLLLLLLLFHLLLLLLLRRRRRRRCRLFFGTFEKRDFLYIAKSSIISLGKINILSFFYDFCLFSLGNRIFP